MRWKVIQIEAPQHTDSGVEAAAPVHLKQGVSFATPGYSVLYLIELLIVQCDGVQDEDVSRKRYLESAEKRDCQFCLIGFDDGRENRQSHILPAISGIGARTGRKSQ